MDISSLLSSLRLYKKLKNQLNRTMVALRHSILFPSDPSLNIPVLIFKINVTAAMTQIHELFLTRGSLFLPPPVFIRTPPSFSPLSLFFTVRCHQHSSRVSGLLSIPFVSCRPVQTRPYKALIIRFISINIPYCV